MQDVAPIINDGNEQWAKVNGFIADLADIEANQQREHKQEVENNS